jgi:ABC-type spermidine/putrescine transport system permease subunit II
LKLMSDLVPPVPPRSSARPFFGWSDRSIPTLLLVLALAGLIVLSLAATIIHRHPMRTLTDPSRWALLAAVAGETVVGVSLGLLLQRLLPRHATQAAIVLGLALLYPAANSSLARTMQNSGTGPRTIGQIWQWTPFMMLLTTAACQGIPRRLLESAAVDRIVGWFGFRNVIVPLAGPVIAMGVTFRFVDQLGRGTYSVSPRTLFATFAVLVVVVVMGWVARRYQELAARTGPDASVR